MAAYLCTCVRSCVNNPRCLLSSLLFVNEHTLLRTCPVLLRDLDMVRDKGKGCGDVGCQSPVSASTNLLVG